MRARAVRRGPELLITALLAACGREPPTCDPRLEGAPRFAEPSAAPGNLLVLVMDDVGVELVGAYGVQAEAPPTPEIDRLAASGVLFRRAYADPVCSPSRAALLTGRHAARFGIGDPIEPFTEDVSLPDAAVTLAEVLRDHAPAYRRGWFGKWHLTSGAAGPDAMREQGFEVFRGTLGNLSALHAYDGEAQSYTSWEQIDDGEVGRATGYVTSRVVDDVLDFAADGGSPWLAVVGFHAAHTPWHSPPLDLHGAGDVSGAAVPAQVRAMVEALDTEIGRLLAGLGAARDHTTVVLVSDNGSTDDAGVGAFAGRDAKSHVYEPGVHVPLIVAGPAVVSGGRTVDAVVQIADLFPMLVGLAGVAPEALDLPLDGVDLGPYLADPQAPARRRWASAETFAHDGSDHQRMLREDRFKLVWRDGISELFDLGDDVLEGAPLSGPLDRDAREAWDRLTGTLEACAAQAPDGA